MEYRILGKTGLKVSALGIGTWQLSGPMTLDGRADGFPDVGAEQAQRIIAACADLGINVIDSAEVYGLEGEGERRVGAAIKGQRDRWVMSTKFGVRRSPDGGRVNDCSPQTIRTSLEGSLRRLQTDYVDIYLYHVEPEPDAIAAGKAVLESLKQEGKIRFYGISSDNPTAVSQFIQADAMEVAQFNHSLVTQPQEILDLVAQHQLGSMVRGALSAGLLSGQYFRQRPQVSEQDIRHPWLSRINTGEYTVYEPYIPAGFTMTAVALRYLLDFPTTHTIVLGGKSVAHYQAAVRALELPPLSEATRQGLMQASLRLQQPSLKRRVINKLKLLALGKRAS